MKTVIASLVLFLAWPSFGGPAVRCTDAFCVNYLQDVGPTHQHQHRCVDTACLNYQQFVPNNHRHLHRNRDTQSPNYQQYVPERPPRRK